MLNRSAGKFLAASAALTMFLTACGGSPETTDAPEAPQESPQATAETTTADIDLTDPTAVVETIFVAANSEEFASLADLCDPSGENDEDTQRICDLPDNEADQASFVEFFAQGKVSGDAEIRAEGSEAEVPFLFGPDGTEEETMVLVNRDGNWYLSSF